MTNRKSGKQGASWETAGGGHCLGSRRLRAHHNPCEHCPLELCRGQSAWLSPVAGGAGG